MSRNYVYTELTNAIEQVMLVGGLLPDDAYINKYGKMVPSICKFVANRKHFSATSPVSGEKIFINLEMAEKASL